MNTLTNPVGIFDAGIGSFGIVETVQKHYPKQDVIWLADRASFPLGQKNSNELVETGKQSIEFLSSKGAQHIIIAANVLTMMVMDHLRKEFSDLKLYGIMPPVENASQYGDFCVLGVKAMVEDIKVKQYAENKKPSCRKVSFANASPLIDELVETGKFITHREQAKKRISEYMSDLPQDIRNASAYTLSSTHLPWLKDIFEELYPDKVFLDPAEDLVSAMTLPNDGNGNISAFTTENIQQEMTAEGLQNILDILGYNHIHPNIIDLSKKLHQHTTC